MKIKASATFPLDVEIEGELEEYEEPTIFPLEFNIFVGNTCVNKEAEYIEGYARGSFIHCGFSFEPQALNDPNLAGTLWFEPEGIAHLWKYGGVSSCVTGFSAIQTERLKKALLAVPKWHGNKVGLVVPYNGVTQKPNGYVYVSMRKTFPKGPAWPWRVLYGIEGTFSVQVP